MAEKALNYKCPCCGAPIHFGTSGNVECDYCGSTYSIQDIETQNAEIEANSEIVNEGTWEYDGVGENWGPDGQEMKVYSCNSCGAELIYDETTSATSCPYCGNPTVLQGNLTGTYAPDYVIPFEITKEKAMEALKNHYKGKKLLPNCFRDQNHIEEIKGVYVPFWLFDGQTDARISFHGTRSRKYTRGNERITETDHYILDRAGIINFKKIPVDASSNMPNDLMDSVEPYDYSKIKDFSVSYLLGYMADKYDVSIEASTDRADRRALQTTEDILRRTCEGYDTVTETPLKRVHIKRGAVKYALIPVWLLNTNYQGRNYLFAVNGQTGKIVGDLPAEKSKIVSYFLKSTAILTVIFTIILWILGM